MAASDQLNIQGRIRVELVGPDGDIKQTYSGKNMIVVGGKNLIVQRLFSNNDIVDNITPLGPIGYMAIGVNSSGVATNNTGLGDEKKRVSIASIRVVDDGTSTIEAIASFGESLTDTAFSVVEAGLFNADVGGTMLSRATFTEFLKSPKDTLNIIWNITVN